MGFGFPAALGVKVAQPDRPVVTVVGDGGFLFASNELATAVQHDIPTVTVVFDDGAYGNSNRDQREKFGGRELGTALRNPDWVALAQAFGAEGRTVEDISGLPDAICARRSRHKRRRCSRCRWTGCPRRSDRLLRSPFSSGTGGLRMPASIDVARHAGSGRAGVAAVPGC